jgi:small-conductance mechanosensitive channel
MTHFFAEVLTPVQRDGLVAVGLLVLIAIAAAAAERILFRIFRKLAADRSESVLAAVLHRAEQPSAFIFPLVAVEAALPYVKLPEWFKPPGEQVLGICIIAAIAWVLVAVIELFADIAKRRYRIDEPDNLRARAVETRVDILNRTATTLVILVGVAAALMTFPPVRAVGATLLASAGLLGLAAGLAARPVLENLVAGVQIALTQPIRIDDVVIVENENGRIEKITATYVVVRLWDLRRMVLPLTYFIDHPFQNLTYSTANLIGSVLIYLDYSLPMADLRAEATRIVEATPLWDHQVLSVAMTDAKETTVEVRVLVSARGSSDLFDLRCLVREGLVEFVRARHPSDLPSSRVILARESDDVVTAAASAAASASNGKRAAGTSGTA